MKKFNWFIFTFLALALFSCEDDEAVLDNDDPQITIIAPTSQAQFYPDETITLQANVTDNLGLDAVSVWVAAPGADEKKVFTEDVRDFLNDNKKAEIEEAITLSTGTPAAGSYVIRVVAVDKAGNEASETVTINVLEADEITPSVVVVSPEENTEFSLGDEVQIVANVEEDKMLREVRVMLGPNGVDPIYTETFTEGFVEGETFAIDEVFTIPADAAVGNYVLTIEAEDLAGNIQPMTIPFRVVEAGSSDTE